MLTASTYHTDPNRRPLTLEHDLTPQDLTSLKRPLDDRKLSPNYRYQGYPCGSFERPRDPLHTPVINPKDLTTEADTRHGLQRYFDTLKPKIHEEENKALLYGSLDMPTNKPTPKPVKDPFQEKTSAELKKFRAVQAEAEKEIEKFKHEKIKKAQDREDEKKKDFDMLRRYNPWGRPGGGAPNKGDSSSSVKSTTPPQKRLSDTQRSYQDDLNEEYGDFHTSFGKPGGGAPLKTLSGCLKTEIKSDEAIHFQDTKNGRVEAEQEFRYKNPRYDRLRYSKDLEKQIKSKSLSHHELRLQELRKERETLTHEPFGKPGGGAPNPTVSGLPENRNTNNYYNFDPWGKGVGQPRRDNRGEVMRHKCHDPKVGMDRLVHNGNTRVSELGVSLIMSDQGGGGAPIKTHSGQVKSRLPMTINRTPFGDHSVGETVRPVTDDPELQPYHPWGRGGAGAPVFDSTGNPVPNIYGRIQNEKGSATPRQKAQAAHEYLKELQGEMIDAERRKRDSDNYFKQGEVDMAALMKRGRVGQPRRDPMTGTLGNQHLGTSDVTKQKMNARPQKTDKSVEYHIELERAAEERRRMRQLDQLKERQEDRQHESTMNNFWGRSGAGAPNADHTKLSKLDDILHSPRREMGQTMSAPYATVSTDVF